MTFTDNPPTVTGSYLEVFDGLSAAAHSAVRSGMTVAEACRHLAIMIQALQEDEENDR